MPQQSEVVNFPGVGAVEPTGEHQLPEIIEAMDTAQKPIASMEIVCIDERRADGEPQPVRAKTSGGVTMTGYAAALLHGNWSLLSDAQKAGDVVDWYGTVVKQQADAGLKLAGHTDNHAAGEKSHCGAADNLAVMIDDAAEHGLEDIWVNTAKAILGEHFSAVRWETRVAIARDLSQRKALQNWRGSMMLDALKANGGVIEVLNGDADEVRDPEGKRHNHWAEGIRINTREGYSNDRDNATIPFFQVDVPAVIESVQPLAPTEDEFLDLLHGAVLYQEAVAFRLTKDLPVDLK